MRTANIALLMALCALNRPIPAGAQVGSAIAHSDEQLEAVKGDLPFVPGQLCLAPSSENSNRKVSLFNGHDLTGWSTWLGAENVSDNYTLYPKAPIGHKDDFDVFSVVREDGRPAIRISGAIWGALTTLRSYHDYHLSLEYKWGAPPPEGVVRNSGILYSSHGEFGAAFNTWKSSVEFDIMPNHVGELSMVGKSHRGHLLEGMTWPITASVHVGQDKTLAYPWRRYSPFGRDAEIQWPAVSVGPSSEQELPAGTWNKLDLYVVGTSALHVVNGVPVLKIDNLAKISNGKKSPLDLGELQLQSEGAEIFFRSIYLTSIKEIPEIIAEKNGFSAIRSRCAN